MKPDEQFNIGFCKKHKNNYLLSEGCNMCDKEELERLEDIKVLRGFRPAERKRYEYLKSKVEKND